MTPLQLPMVAYVDTTAVLPIAFREEPAATSVQRRLDSFPHLLSANLLETELRTAFKYEGQDFDNASISKYKLDPPQPPDGRRNDGSVGDRLSFAHSCVASDHCNVFSEKCCKATWLSSPWKKNRKRWRENWASGSRRRSDNAQVGFQHPR